MKFRSTAIVLMLGLGPSAAFADGGAIELNQLCAQGAGCFAGDASGFPVEITSPGTYQLTGDLVLPAGTGGIVVEAPASGAVLDLNGFAIRGPESCAGTPVTDCTGATSAAGITATFATDVEVRDGLVTGMSNDGVRLGVRSKIANVRAVENGANGISAGENSLFEEVTVDRNGNFGIIGPPGSKVTGSTSNGNGADGIRLFDAGVVLASTANDNGQCGIAVGVGGVVASSSASGNVRSGFCNLGGLVSESAADGNGMDGVECSPGAERGAVRGSVLTGNGAENIGSTCIEIQFNLCDGSTTCN